MADEGKISAKRTERIKSIFDSDDSDDEFAGNLLKNNDRVDDAPHVIGFKNGDGKTAESASIDQKNKEGTDNSDSSVKEMHIECNLSLKNTEVRGDAINEIESIAEASCEPPLSNESPPKNETESCSSNSEESFDRNKSDFKFVLQKAESTLPVSHIGNDNLDFKNILEDIVVSCEEMVVESEGDVHEEKISSAIIENIDSKSDTKYSMESNSTSTNFAEVDLPLAEDGVEIMETEDIVECSSIVDKSDNFSSNNILDDAELTSNKDEVETEMTVDEESKIGVAESNQISSNLYLEKSQDNTDNILFEDDSVMHEEEITETPLLLNSDISFVNDEKSNLLAINSSSDEEDSLRSNEGEKLEGEISASSLIEEDTTLVNCEGSEPSKSVDFDQSETGLTDKELKLVEKTNDEDDSSNDINDSHLNCEIDNDDLSAKESNENESIDALIEHSPQPDIPIGKSDDNVEMKDTDQDELEIINKEDCENSDTISNTILIPAASNDDNKDDNDDEHVDKETKSPIPSPIECSTVEEKILNQEFKNKNDCSLASKGNNMEINNKSSLSLTSQKDNDKSNEDSKISDDLSPKSPIDIESVDEDIDIEDHIEQIDSDGDASIDVVNDKNDRQDDDTSTINHKKRNLDRALENDMCKDQVSKKVRVEDIFTDSDNNASDDQSNLRIDESIQNVESPKCIKNEKENYTLEKELSTKKRMKATNIESINMPLIILAFEQGWTRQIVFRSATCTSNNKADVYYYSPNGSKLRSKVQIEEYLKKYNIQDLSVKNFTFFKEPLNVGSKYEKIRYSKSKVKLDEIVKTDEVRQVVSNITPSLTNSSLSSLVTNTTSTSLVHSNKLEKPKLKSVREKLNEMKQKFIEDPPIKSNVLSQSLQKTKAMNKNLMAAKNQMQKMMMNRQQKRDIAIYATHLYPCNPPLTHPRIVTPLMDTSQSHKSYHCTPLCKEGKGSVPSIQCVKCFCLFHPECCHMPIQVVAIIQAALARFLCPNCYDEEQLPKDPTYKLPSCYEPLAFDPSSSEDEGIEEIDDDFDNKMPRISQMAKMHSSMSPSNMPARLSPARTQFRKRILTDKKSENQTPTMHLIDVIKRNKIDVSYNRSQDERIHDFNGDNNYQSEGILDVELDKKMILPISTIAVGVRGGNDFVPDMSQAYHVMRRIFSYLSVNDLLLASRVCFLWRDLAWSPEFWSVVRLRNICVNDWAAMVLFLTRRGTKELDLRKMVVNIKMEKSLPECEERVEKEEPLIDEGGFPLGEEELKQLKEKEEQEKEIIEKKRKEEIERLEEEKRRKEEEEKKEKEEKERIEKETRDRLEEERKEKERLETLRKEKEEKERVERECKEKEEKDRLEQELKEKREQEIRTKQIFSSIWNEHDYFGRVAPPDTSSSSSSSDDSDTDSDTESETETLERVRLINPNIRAKKSPFTAPTFSPKMEDPDGIHHMDIDAIVKEGETFLQHASETSAINKKTKTKFSALKTLSTVKKGEKKARKSTNVDKPVKNTKAKPKRQSNSASTNKALLKENRPKEVSDSKDGTSKEETIGPPIPPPPPPPIKVIDPKTEGPFSAWHIIASSLKSLPTLEKIIVGTCEPDVVEILLSYCHNLKSIIALSLASKGEEGSITSFDPSFLMHTRIIEELKLASQNSFTFKSNFNFIKLPNLKILVLKGLVMDGWPYMGVNLTHLHLGSIANFNSKNWMNISSMTNLVELCLEAGGSDHDNALCLALPKMVTLSNLALLNWSVGSKLPHILKRISNLKKFHIIPSLETESERGVNAGRLMVVIESMKMLEEFSWGILLENVVSEEKKTDKIYMRTMKAGKETCVAEGEDVRTVTIEGIRKFLNFSSSSTIFKIKKVSNTPWNWTPWDN